MVNKFKVEIQETVEELEHRLERVITSVSKEKLLLLYWIATEKNQNKRRISHDAEARLFNNISLV
jgi:hypothetical protein